MADITQDDWSRIKRKAELFFIANNVTDPAVKVATFLYKCGDEISELYDSTPKVTASLDESYNEYAVLLSTLDSHFVRRHNNLLEIYMLRQMKQQVGETLDMFVFRVRAQMRKCNMESDQELEMLLAIVSGTTMKSLRDKILDTDGITLDRALQFGHMQEDNRERNREFLPVAVHRVESASKRKREGLECYGCGFEGHRMWTKDCPRH